MNKFLLICAGAAMLASCSQRSNVVKIYSDGSQMPAVETLPVQMADSKPNYARLNATLFKMSGDYANNVAVTLNPDGSLAYYPDPRDISESSAPVEVGEGWWLNRQGISENSVFTRYTFEEYSKLPQVPSRDELKAAIIPGARVTEFRRLILPASEARGLAPSELLKYIND